MFRFNFDIDGDSELEIPQDQFTLPSSNGNISCGSNLPAEEPCREIPIQDLLDSLPSLISCSPLSTPLRDGSQNFTLTRRDLFDARFQLIAEGTGPDGADPCTNHTEDRTDEREETEDSEEKQHRHASALQFIEAPSDLVPRVYEGGLKTWECSIDLVEYLDSSRRAEGFSGKHILELGCGTAVPSLYALYRIFSTPPPSGTKEVLETVIYLQDYNDSVLELVTLPNVLLTWCQRFYYHHLAFLPFKLTSRFLDLSPASQAFRTLNATSSVSDTDDLPFPTTPGPFELPISTSLKTAFLISIKETYNLSIRFFSGSWSSFSTQLQALHPQKFDLVLTSETIYRIDSLPSLVETMRLAFAPAGAGVKENANGKGECLVAAKVLYFGVGGGVSDFVDFVERQGIAKAKVVRETKTGVGRLILSLDFT